MNIVSNKIWIGKLFVCLSITGVIDNHDGWVGRFLLYSLAASVGAMQDLARLSRYPQSHRVSPAAKLSLTSNPISVHR